ncbi:hypothetical protein ACRRTK_010397 [Alexandromys fortis]
MKEKDVLKFLATGTYLDGTNLDFQLEQYIYKRKTDGIHIISLKRDSEETEKEEQAADEKAVTKEEFQGEWMEAAPEFTAAQSEVAD